MPAPTKAELKLSVRAAFIAAGPTKFAKRTDQGAVVPGELPDALEDMIDAFTEGLANRLATWQAAQTVSVVGVTPGVGTAVGTLP